MKGSLDVRSSPTERRDERRYGEESERESTRQREVAGVETPTGVNFRRTRRRRGQAPWVVLATPTRAASVRSAARERESHVGMDEIHSD